jgi:uncharacterized protein YqcC (DUF446 family)
LDFTPPKIPPLQGKALDEAVHQLLSRHLRDTEARQGFESSGVFRHPTIRAMLERMARQEHRALQSLRALDQQKRAWQSQREGRAMSTPASTAPASNQPMSKEALAVLSDEIWLQWRDADQAGDMVRANMLKTKLAQIDEQRFRR